MGRFSGSCMGRFCRPRILGKTLTDDNAALKTVGWVVFSDLVRGGSTNTFKRFSHHPQINTFYCFPRLFRFVIYPTNVASNVSIEIRQGYHRVYVVKQLKWSKNNLVDGEDFFITHLYSLPIIKPGRV